MSSISKTKITTYKLYGGKVEIEYHETEKTHWFANPKSKERISGVTSITGLLDKSGVLMAWASRIDKAHLLQYFETATGNMFSREELIPVIEEAFRQHNVKKEAAADIGTQVHDYAEAFVKARLAGQPAPEINDSWPDPVLNGVMAFLDWVNSEPVKFLAAERIIYSKKHNYAGKSDVVLEYDGAKVVGDYKTGKGIYSDHYYQLSAYWNALEEEDKIKYPKGLILHFNKETGDFKPYWISRDDHLKNLDAFLGLRAVKIREGELKTDY